MDYRGFLLFLSACGLVDASSGVVPMQFFRNEPRGLDIAKRQTPFDVDVGNARANGLYYVNVTIGSPPITVNLQLDTGSSDLWVFGPHSCNSSTSLCLGGDYDSSQSATAAIESNAPEFNITYETLGSGVQGFYVQDTVKLGGATLTSLTFAQATYAAYVPVGIMGVGFDNFESLVVYLGDKPYQNVVDAMVTQNLISTRAYSLYLDDLDSASGTVLFGGYDTEKYHGDLAPLKIYPNAQTGVIDTFAVALTAMAVTGATGTTVINSTTLPVAAVLDSGTTATVLPSDIFDLLVKAFNVEEVDPELNVIDCSYSTANATLDYQFGGDDGPVIQVPFSEIVYPLLNASTGDPVTDSNGNTICQFGIVSDASGLSILLGDTFLRSAYVVYDLDAETIFLAQTKFDSTESNVKSIAAGSSSGSNSSSAALPVSSVTYSIESVSQTGSLNLGPGTALGSSAKSVVSAVTISSRTGLGLPTTNAVTTSLSQTLVPVQQSGSTIAASSSKPPSSGASGTVKHAECSGTFDILMFCGPAALILSSMLLL